MFNIGLYRDKHETIFLSEIKMPRSLIFVEVYSNHTPWAKIGAPSPGSNFFHRLI